MRNAQCIFSYLSGLVRLTCQIHMLLAVRPSETDCLELPMHQATVDLLSY